MSYAERNEICKQEKCVVVSIHDYTILPFLEQNVSCQKLNGVIIDICALCNLFIIDIFTPI